MHEIEVKILEIDQAEVEKKLRALGARKIFAGDLEWIAFRWPRGEHPAGGSMLRLRKRGSKTELTFKKLLSKKRAKISEEIEVQIADYEKMQRVLLAIGLRPKAGFPLKKHRISYELGTTHFEIDTLPGFPTYLEIEAPTVEEAVAYGKRLGFTKRELKAWGTREVFAHYRKI